MRRHRVFIKNIIFFLEPTNSTIPGSPGIWSAKCPATNLAAGEYQYSTIFEKIGNRKKNHGISSIWSAKCPAASLAARAYQYSAILKKLEPKEKSRNIFYLISKMSCNKSGSRTVPIQHYFERNWNRKNNHGISSIWSAKCPATNLAAGEYQYSTILKKIGIERIFDEQNVLQQIWQPESTNTALFLKK